MVMIMCDKELKKNKDDEFEERIIIRN